MLLFLDRHIYINTLIIYTLLSANVIAENEKILQILNEEEFISDNLNVDVLDEIDEETDEDIVEDDPVETKSEKSFFLFLDAPHRIISHGVESFAKSIDEFFSDDKVFYDSSGTYLRLRADTTINERGEKTYKGDVKLKLRIPNTKKKLKLTLESDPNDRPDEVSEQGENTPIAAIEDKDYFAGIQATLGKKDAWQFKPSIGLRLSSPVEPYVRFRIKKKYEFNKWNLHLQETPYWFNSSGWGSDSYIELNRKISADDLFRSATFARWTDESDQFELSQTFTMYHTLSKRRAISYFTGVYGISEPTVHATHYLLGLTYRQNIHKDYLFAEIVPQIRYEKDNDFHAEHSVLIRLEIVFRK